MPTITQLIRKQRVKKSVKSKAPALAASPQKRGVCKRVYTTTPRKPNSAMRKVCTVVFTNGYECICYIGGEGHNVQEHGVLLVKGGGLKICPGLNIISFAAPLTVLVSKIVNRLVQNMVQQGQRLDNHFVK